MHITINAPESCTDIPDCMTAEEITEVTLEEHLSSLAQLVSWPSTKTEVHKELKPYWSFRDEVTIRDKTAIKERINILKSVQEKKINQLHISQKGTE